MTPDMEKERAMLYGRMQCLLVLALLCATLPMARTCPVSPS